MQLAEALGARAVPVLSGFCVLACLLCAALTLHGREWHVWQHPPALRRLCMSLCALGLAGFAVIAWSLREGGSLLAFDHALTAALGRDVGRDTLFGFALLTQLGDTGTLITVAVIVTAVLAWRRRYRLAWAWVVLVAAGGSMNPLLKALFGRVRPDRSHDIVSYPGLSFPSGHASFSFLVYALLTYLILRYATRAWHLPMILLACLFVVVVGFSRVILQVHFFSDVLAGWCYALAWVSMSVALLEALRLRP